jgi:ribosomal protein S15
VFSLKIACVKEHLRRHPKDVSARLNLEKLEVKRRGMMEYLKRIGYERYLRCIRMLGLPDTAKGYKKVRRAKIFN